jgi:hypothetical protein
MPITYKYNGIPISDFLYGYNAVGTTNGYSGFGSYTDAISDYRKSKQNFGYNYIGSNIIYNSETIYSVNASANVTAYNDVPSWSNKIRILAIGAGGGGCGGYSAGGNARGPGGGGAFFLYDVTGPLAGSTISTFCGKGGSGAIYNNDNATSGTASIVTITKSGYPTVTLTAGGGGKGNATPYVDGTAGTVSINQNGNTIFTLTTTYVNSSKSGYIGDYFFSNTNLPGGNSGLTRGYNDNTYDTSYIDNITSPYTPGVGGAGTRADGIAGTDGYVSIHYFI